MKTIELTLKGGKEITINIEHLEYFTASTSYPEKTSLFFHSKAIIVNESYETVQSMIKKL